MGSEQSKDESGAARRPPPPKQPDREQRKPQKVTGARGGGGGGDGGRGKSGVVGTDEDEGTDDDDDDDSTSGDDGHSKDEKSRGKEDTTKKSWFQQAQKAYDDLVMAIIRPPRCDYKLSELGPMSFDFCGKIYVRRDIELRNERRLTLICSMWEPASAYRTSELMPCVVYMHGNSSSRLEALSQLSLVLSMGATLFTLDFCGSGWSEGEYVSLGAYEKEDLKCVIQYLRSPNGKASKIALWGRSMGAATAMMYAGSVVPPKHALEPDNTVAAMVCDSCFTSLVTLAEELVDRGRRNGVFAPGFLISIAIQFIRWSVTDKAKFDVMDLDPLASASKSTVPLMLICAEDDAFIPPHHSRSLYTAYAGTEKHALVVEGDHNSVRPRYMYDHVVEFFTKHLDIPASSISHEGMRFVGVNPWTSQLQTGNGSSASVPLQKRVALSMMHQNADRDNGDLDDSEDIGVGMDKRQQADTKAKINALLGAGF